MHKIYKWEIELSDFHGFRTKATKADWKSFQPQFKKLLSLLIQDKYII
jgi:hypothetical protein